MIELKGKYNTAIVYTDNVDNGTIGQIIALLNQESMKDSTIRIMPDCHQGAGCVIGTTMTIKDKVIPNLVGVDIGCGVYVAKLKESRIELPKLDSIINKKIPSGFNIRDNEHKYADNTGILNLRCSHSIHYDRAYKSIGTLGGGNHFIEVDKDSRGAIYLVVHTGSRHLGKEVADYYQENAWNIIKNNGKEELIKGTIEKLKSENRQQDIEKEIHKIKEVKSNVPHELAYCEGSLFDDYIHDMKIVQEFAYWNRKAIIDTICKEMKLHIEDEFETIHNYIDTKNMILRKGAVSAAEGEKLLIPINMRDGSLLCIGKGNEDWNYSAPHGAGRICSRSEAKQRFTVSEFKKTMKEAGIYTTSVGQSTLDECPMTYKNIDEILNNVTDTVDIVEVIKPIYNFKAGEEQK